jgi:GTP-binding protein EngB required for normal cell division
MAIRTRNNGKGPVKEQQRARVVQEKYDKFRILVIGRANAGKTTILQRTCNTTDEPMIYDKAGKVVSATPLGEK